MATIAALFAHYTVFYLGLAPLLTEAIAEWVMARTPNAYALWLLGTLGPWAKPFAMTAGLAALGFGVLLIALIPGRWLKLPAAALCGWAFGSLFDYHSISGLFSFWSGALVFLFLPWPPAVSPSPKPGNTRREALAMIGGTVLVAGESWFRERLVSGREVAPVGLAPFEPPPEKFAPALVRKAITPIDTFYVMSKNAVDPALEPRTWNLRITIDGRAVRTVSYGELLSMPRTSEYVTMRCISNTLQSDLMGTAMWSGIRLNQLIDPGSIPGGIVEAAVIGVDGHGDSFNPQYLLSDGAMLAFAMNGSALTRAHGYPLRLIVPRYYGFKNVKWIGEIAFVRKPYIGTWPKLGYTKEPVVHTASHIDKILRGASTMQVGGVSFAGDRGIRAVRVRADQGPWVSATLETPLSRFTWTRWSAELATARAARIEAQAQDGAGNWQEAEESPLFPDGVKGPTIRKIS